MKSLRRAASRFRGAGSIPVLAALLALAVSAPLAAGEHSRPHDSSDQGRTAQPRSDSGSRPSGPSYSPPPSSGSSGSSGWSGPSSTGQERVATPRTESNGNSHQQRPRTGSRNDWRGGWHGGGGYYGGYGGGYYSPYNRYYWGPYFGWGWWGWGGGDGYYGYGSYDYPRYYGDRYDRYDRNGRATGALDIDVSPGKTEVWIDDRYVGTADDFDGFPQYLWLDKGVYDLVLYREGYVTLARQITVYPDAVVSIDDRMQRGESVKPQDLATKTHERRDERIRYEDERREEIARRGNDGMEDWRDRARRRMEERGRYDQGGRADRADRADVGAAEADGSGHLHLEILPADASVYLDGKFVGTGIDLQRVSQGLRLEPGEHRIAVVRPGHKAEEQKLTVAPGEDVDLEIELESME